MSLELVVCHGQNVIIVCLGTVSWICVPFGQQRFSENHFVFPLINTEGFNSLMITIRNDNIQN